MSFPRYPAYKDSGVEWLGSVPLNWRRARFKEVFQEREERSIAGEETLLSVSAYTGVTPRSEIMEDGDHLSRAESLEGYKVCYPNDLVMNIMLAWNRGLGMSPIHGICSPAYSVFQIVDESSPRYLHYLLRSDEYIRYFKAFSAGVIDSRLRLYPDAFGALSTYLPSTEEQAQIACFLDRETAKIDALVAEQEQLITLLKEKRQAVISHAVTKGLDPSVPMKDSGVEWLGEVPAHWEVVRVKHLVNAFEQGWSPQCENFPVESASDWGVLKVGCVNGGIFNPGENKALPPDLTPLPELGISSGDLLISRANTRELVGSAAVALADHHNLMLCDKLYRLRLDPDLCLPAFLSLFLGTERARGQIELTATGASSSMLNISQATILEMCLALPPIAEQQVLLQRTGESTTRLEQLMKEAVLSIELLRERRSALISAAVTGQIDVRGLAPALEQAA